MTGTSGRAQIAARGLLWVFGIALVALGAVSLATPEQLLRWVEIPLTTPTALADARALYGGVPLAIGGLFLYALREPSWLVPCLALAMASTGGPALARAYSIVASGMPNTLVLIYMAFEVLGFLWAWSIFRKLRHTTPRGGRG